MFCTVNAQYIHLHIYHLCCSLLRYTFLCFWLEFFPSFWIIPLFRVGLLVTSSPFSFAWKLRLIFHIVAEYNILVWQGFFFFQHFKKYFYCLLVSIIPLLFLWKLKSFFLWLHLVLFPLVFYNCSPVICLDVVFFVFIPFGFMSATHGVPWICSLISLF